MTNSKNIFITIIVLILLAGNAFFAYSYLNADKELKVLKANESKVETNAKVIEFTSLFIKKVLQADKEVDFETRLSLENSVRDLKDEEIKAEWQNFIASKTESDAQNSVKKLLGILITKIQK